MMHHAVHPVAHNHVVHHPMVHHGTYVMAHHHVVVVMHHHGPGFGRRDGRTEGGDQHDTGGDQALESRTRSSSLEP